MRQVDLLVEQYPGFIIPINMFAIDIRKLGGTIKQRNSTDVNEPWVFERVVYNLQEDLIIFFGKNPTLSPGDEVTLEIDYDASVNFNVMNGYGIWKQPCTDTQVSNKSHVEKLNTILRNPKPNSAGLLSLKLWARDSCCLVLMSLEPRPVLMSVWRGQRDGALCSTRLCSAQSHTRTGRDGCGTCLRPPP